jgi:hypothetical protein
VVCGWLAGWFIWLWWRGKAGASFFGMMQGLDYGQDGFIMDLLVRKSWQ